MSVRPPPRGRPVMEHCEWHTTEVAGICSPNVVYSNVEDRLKGRPGHDVKLPRHGHDVKLFRLGIFLS